MKSGSACHHFSNGLSRDVKRRHAPRRIMPGPWPSLTLTITGSLSTTEIQLASSSATLPVFCCGRRVVVEKFLDCGILYLDIGRCICQWCLVCRMSSLGHTVLDSSDWTSLQRIQFIATLSRSRYLSCICEPVQCSSARRAQPKVTWARYLRILKMS